MTHGRPSKTLLARQTTIRSDSERMVPRGRKIADLGLPVEVAPARAGNLCHRLFDRKLFSGGFSIAVGAFAVSSGHHAGRKFGHVSGESAVATLRELMQNRPLIGRGTAPSATVIVS